MFRFSLAELMLVAAAVAVAATGIALPAHKNQVMAIVTAILLGVTIAGPPLLYWRWRGGRLKGPWGLGEMAWFFLGLYFLPLVAWSITFPLNKAASDRWLTVGFVMSASILAAALVLLALRWFVRILGAPTPANRPWFHRRGTNLLGLALLALYAACAGITISPLLDWTHPLFTQIDQFFYRQRASVPRTDVLNNQQFRYVGLDHANYLCRRNRISVVRFVNYAGTGPAFDRSLLPLGGDSRDQRDASKEDECNDDIGSPLHCDFLFLIRVTAIRGNNSGTGPP